MGLNADARLYSAEQGNVTESGVGVGADGGWRIDVFICHQQWNSKRVRSRVVHQIIIAIWTF